MTTTDEKPADISPSNDVGCSGLLADLCQRLRKHIRVMAPHQKQRQQGELLIAAEYALRKLEDGIPAIDRLQERLEAGYRIAKQDGMWHLFAPSGDGLVCGPTLRKMMLELVFVE